MSRVDWDAARSKIQANAEALDRVFNPDPRQIESAFQRRATALARRQTDLGRRQSCTPIVVFELSSGRYGIELNHVVEAMASKAYTPVPGSDKRFLGVINVRGELRPLLSLPLALGRPSDGKDLEGSVLLLQSGALLVAVKTGAIEGILSILPEELETSGTGPFTKGIARRSIVLIDVERMLSAILKEREVAQR